MKHPLLRVNSRIYDHWSCRQTTLLFKIKSSNCWMEFVTYIKHRYRMWSSHLYNLPLYAFCRKRRERHKEQGFDRNSDGSSDEERDRSPHRRDDSKRRSKGMSRRANIKKKKKKKKKKHEWESGSVMVWRIGLVMGFEWNNHHLCPNNLPPETRGDLRSDELNCVSIMDRITKWKFMCT